VVVAFPRLQDVVSVADPVGAAAVVGRAVDAERPSGDLDTADVVRQSQCPLTQDGSLLKMAAPPAVVVTNRIAPPRRVRKG
jgi:ribosomal protein L14